MQLVTGKPVYMDDLAPADCLIVKLYRSPHANAMVERIDTSVAQKRCPASRPSSPGRMWTRTPAATRRPARPTPEASPYDRLVIDRHVRFVGGRGGHCGGQG